eukprot:CAMPEP_0182417376 /NCGR_PEP_ID=MMETSP1167-20130531/1836_1 /TAXON_ID=2988 /ORGANISM="Mallomonas Sp, Strain CCMP3275" /LENGTH=465 /DNA_ID=CAMNT_0024590893 /DNA_START=53 /DNA_END=1450 /DNA_ORIENTATION=-
MTDSGMTDPAKLLLLAALLAKDRIISSNAKSFLKELILRRDPRLLELLRRFESKETGDNAFMESIHDLIEDESHSLYNELFSDTTLELGKTLSKEERDMKNLNDEKSLIYGEVDYTSFYRVLRKINPVAGGVFYDLGSGTGKAVFAARLTQDFVRCAGVEVLHGLHKQGQEVLTKYNCNYRQFLCSGQSQQVVLHEGSLLEFDWSDGDVIFANSTCYDDNLMSDMAQLAQNLKPGAFFVTFTKGLDSPHFEVLERKRYRMSWGPATVFIHRRLGLDGEPVGPVRLNTLPSDARAYVDATDDMDLDEDESEEEEEEEGDDVDLGSEERETETEREGEDDGDDEKDEEEWYDDEFDTDGERENENTKPPQQPLCVDTNPSHPSPSRHSFSTSTSASPSLSQSQSQSGPRSLSHSLQNSPAPLAIPSGTVTPLSLSLTQRLGGRLNSESEMHSPQDTALLRRKIARRH